MSHGDQTEKKPSFLSDLPPLGSSGKGSSLPPLKKSGSKDGGSLGMFLDLVSVAVILSRQILHPVR